MKKITIRRWFLFTDEELGPASIPLVLDLSNEDIDDDEIAMCIGEQVYSQVQLKPIRHKDEIERIVVDRIPSLSNTSSPDKKLRRVK